MTAYDLLVVGGGVQGLWVARRAVEAGIKVALMEAERCGAGASGGQLGALMPHIATGWSEKKQFQLEALVGLEEEIARLSGETGLETGYSRCGRIMPIRAMGFKEQFESRRLATWRHWRTSDRRFELEMLEADAFRSWLAPEAAKYGVFWDPLAARIDPLRYISALKASIADRCAVLEGCRFQGYDAATERVASQPDSCISAAAVVLAAGYETFSLTKAVTGLDLGAGVKGQAVVLEARMPNDRPIIYDDGMYIVAHKPDVCAVGSTTQAEWTDPRSVDDGMSIKLAQARRLCPPLRDARVVGSWAGVRPKSAARDPIVGRLCDGAAMYVASGGFKITLGIAHRVAEKLVDGIARNAAVTGLPGTFAPDLHMAAARAKLHRPVTGEIA